MGYLMFANIANFLENVPLKDVENRLVLDEILCRVEYRGYRSSVVCLPVCPSVTLLHQVETVQDVRYSDHLGFLGTDLWQKTIL